MQEPALLIPTAVQEPAQLSSPEPIQTTGPQVTVTAAAAAVIQTSAVAAAVLPAQAVAAAGLPNPVAAAAVTKNQPSASVNIRTSFTL